MAYSLFNNNRIGLTSGFNAPSLEVPVLGSNQVIRKVTNVSSAVSGSQDIPQPSKPLPISASSTGYVLPPSRNEPTAGAPFSPVSVCPPGTRELILSRENAHDGLGNVYEVTTFICIPIGNSAEPTGGIGYGGGVINLEGGTGGIDLGGPVTRSGTGSGKLPKTEDEDEDGAEIKKMAVARIKRELHFAPCNPADPYGKRSGTSAEGYDCCCTEEQRTQIATLLYELSQRRIFNWVPWMWDCIMETARSVEICCKGPYPSELDPNREKKIEEWRYGVLDNRQLVVWSDKLDVKRESSQRLLVEPLLRNCRIEMADIPLVPLKDHRIEFEMSLLFENMWDFARLCKTIDDWEEWDNQNLEETCKGNNLQFVFFRFVALNLCTGELFRLKREGRGTTPKEVIDLDRGPIGKWKIPTRSDCDRIEHPDQGFEEVGHKFIYV